MFKNFHFIWVPLSILSLFYLFIGCGSETHTNTSQPQYFKAERCVTQNKINFTFNTLNTDQNAKAERSSSVKCDNIVNIWLLQNSKYPEETCAYGRYFSAEKTNNELNLDLAQIVQESDRQFSKNAFSMNRFLGFLEGQKIESYNNEKELLNATTTSSAMFMILLGFVTGRAAMIAPLPFEFKVIIGPLFVVAAPIFIWSKLASMKLNPDNSYSAKALTFLSREYAQPKEDNGSISLDNTGITEFLMHIQSGHGHPCPSLEEAKSLVGF